MRTLLAALLILLASAGSAGAITMKGFQTPSRNIKCMGGRDAGHSWLRCDIYAHSWASPTLPPCTDAGDRGSSLSLSARGRTRWPCVSDAVDSGRVLAYGAHWSFGPFHCMSRRVGLTCKNLAGHGWFLSRERYRIS